MRPDEDNDRILTALIVRSLLRGGLEVVKTVNNQENEGRAATLVLARCMRDIQAENRRGTQQEGR